MKTLIKFLHIYIFIILIFNSDLFAQNECGTSDTTDNPDYNYIGGHLKPQRTDRDNGNASQSDAKFHMLFVFIQFTDETVQSSEWPIGDTPVYKSRFLVENKNGSGDFWNRYKDSSLSDYYQEVSKGAFHVTGITRHLVTYHSWNYYANGIGYSGLLTEIYTRLKADTTIRWTDFDKWSQNNTTYNYVNEKDKYLDMMGLFFRHIIGYDFLNSGIGAGEVPLRGPDNFVLFANSTDTVKIDADRTATGSGFIAKGNIGEPLGYNKSLGIAIHEYGHYLFDNVHSASGIMTSRGGISINDLFMSGYEKYRLGLSDTITVNFSSLSSYSIRDISGRNSAMQSPDFPELIKVPISSTEFFIIENRRKILDWDVYMLGDTSKTDPFKKTGDYGKGVYIYHSNNVNLSYAGSVDIECADGLWDWTYSGTTTPDWSTTQPVRLYTRDSLPSIVNNDNGEWGYFLNKDGVSFADEIASSYYPCFFSLGKRHTSINSLPGTDKVYTNYPEYWTSRELWGDRFDAWNIGYNQVFSPYSNPNTKKANNAESGIFIYYNSMINDIANIKIYKIDEPYSLDSILKWTPPSKPMGIVVDYYLEGENYVRPQITWNHNMEPDMIRNDSTKRYKIWRATQTTLAYIPTNYTLLKILDIDKDSSPSYIDTSIIALGSGWPGMGEQIQYPVRYTVQAIDNYQDSSVRSDFGSIIGIRNCGIACASTEYNISFNETELPDEYSVSQNFPNPFNPTTNIKYSIPQDNYVSIKIYNLLGKEVMNLINDFKKAGSYSISFDGSNLPSGVYYYKIKAGEFVQIRKMVLIK